VYLGLPNGELLAVPADGESDGFSLLGRLGAWLRRSERARLAGLLRREPPRQPAGHLTPHCRARRQPGQILTGGIGCSVGPAQRRWP
jgi:hypothetical protein